MVDERQIHVLLCPVKVLCKSLVSGGMLTLSCSAFIVERVSSFCLYTHVGWLADLMTAEQAGQVSARFFFFSFVPRGVC